MHHLCVWTSQIHPLYPLHYSNDAKFVQMTQQISCASDTIGVVEVGRIYGRFTPAFTFSITIANETDDAINCKCEQMACNKEIYSVRTYLRQLNFLQEGMMLLYLSRISF